jgi:RNA polymerase sigma factor (sigma-70 family)
VTVAAKLQREGRTSWPDDRLVAESLEGNQQAWSTLVDKYKNLIFSIPIKLGLYEDAADIFQAVCLDLLTGLPRLRKLRALPKWLMQTCYHKCLQCRRRAEEHVPLGEEDGETSPTNGSLSPLPDDMLVQLEKEQIVFFETPPRPYEEIAQELGIATGSIGFIRGRCLGKLK